MIFMRSSWDGPRRVFRRLVFEDCVIFAWGCAGDWHCGWRLHRSYQHAHGQATEKYAILDPPLACA